MVVDVDALVVGATLVGTAVELSDAELCSESEHPPAPRTSVASATNATSARPGRFELMVTGSGSTPLVEDR
jgi:hypothetical protein